MDCRDGDMACEISLNIIGGIAESWRLFSAYTRKLLINIMLCDWLKFKVDIQLFLSYGVYASVIFVIFFAEVKYMISPNGGGYISKVVSKLVRNNALISFNRVFFSF